MSVGWIGFGLVTGTFAWLPVAALAVVQAINVSRGILRHSAAKAYFPDHWDRLKTAAWLDVAMEPLSVFCNWIGMSLAFFGRTIVWRGIEYRMDRNGKVLSLARRDGEKHAESRQLVPNYALRPRTSDTPSHARSDSETEWHSVLQTRRNGIPSYNQSVPGYVRSVTEAMIGRRNFPDAYCPVGYAPERTFRKTLPAGWESGNSRAAGRFARRLFGDSTCAIGADGASIRASGGPSSVNWGIRSSMRRNVCPNTADLYVFNPVLISLKQEIEVMRKVKASNPGARVWVVGTVASVMPEAFEGLDVTVIRGEAEQLLWTMDQILEKENATVQLGAMEDLDAIPFPDWTPFRPKSFRIGYDFTRFPTALIQQSRGCTMKCNYCPYILLENQTRFRDPEAVVDEIRHDMDRWGFRSFKFRDPLFGADKKRLFRLIEQLARLPRRIQFSIESRIELLPPEVLRALKSVGLTSITVGIETPDEEMQRKYRRAPIKETGNHEFIARCRELGIRTVAGFMIGFPEDTEASVRRVLRLRKTGGPDLRELQRRHPLPRHRILRPDQGQDYRFRFFALHGLHAAAQIRPPHRRADVGASREVLPPVLLPLGLPPRERRTPLAGVAIARLRHRPFESHTGSRHGASRPARAENPLGNALRRPPSPRRRPARTPGIVVRGDAAGFGGVRVAGPVRRPGPEQGIIPNPGHVSAEQRGRRLLVDGCHWLLVSQCMPEVHARGTYGVFRTTS